MKGKHKKRSDIRATAAEQHRSAERELRLQEYRQRLHAAREGEAEAMERIAAKTSALGQLAGIEQELNDLRRVNADRRVAAREMRAALHRAGRAFRDDFLAIAATHRSGAGVTVRLVEVMKWMDQHGLVGLPKQTDKRQRRHW